MTRAEAIAKINRLRNEYNGQYIDYCGTNEAVNMAIEALKAEPIKHGHWIKHGPKEGHLIEKYTCSECGFYSGTRTTNYCPNCGVKMDEVTE